MMDSFESRFEDIILLKGKQFYVQGRVGEVKKINRAYVAICKGNRDYNVSISIQDDFVYGDCSCPYAVDGKFCIHIAAVLYKIKYEGYEYIDKDYEETINAAFEERSQEQKNLFKSDDEIKEEYYLSLLEEFDDYKTKINNVFDMFCEDLKFIKHDSVEDFEWEINRVIYEISTEQSQFDLVYNAVTYILERLNDLDFFDCDDILGNIVKKCFNVFELIIEDRYNEVFHWIINHLSEYPYIEEPSFSLLRKYYFKNQYLHRLKEFLVSIIDDKESSSYVDFLREIHHNLKVDENK